MSKMPEPPHTHRNFVKRFPALGEAWTKIAEAGRDGPLDDKTVRLVKLGLAIGAMHEGAVHASVRKAVAMGISREEIEQVLALAAGTIGMPAVAAAYTWVEEQADKSGADT